jgi:magnesium-transporting ATPase (P-type)
MIGIYGKPEQRFDDDDVPYYSLSPEQQDVFDQAIDTLKVLARASPDDKLIMVAGLKG